MSILTSSRPLCLCPIKISSCRIVTHLLPHPFPQSIPSAVNGISHSFTSAPQKKVAVSSVLLSANPTQVPMVPLRSMLLIRGNRPCASLACCSLNLALLLCLFPLESLHLLVSHLQHQGGECSAAARAHCCSVEPPQNFQFSQSS